MLERIDDLAAAGAEFMFETTLATLTYAQKIPCGGNADMPFRSSICACRQSRRPSIRVRRRVEAGGHGIPEETVRRRFDKSVRYFESAYKSVVDEWYVRDSLEGSFALAESWDRKMSRRLDITTVDAALKRAANKAIAGTREERSGRFQRVKSSMMTSLRYDHDARELHVTFTSGKTYRYLHVPLEVYVALLDAESKGDFFNGNIKEAFAFAKASSRRER